MKKLLLVAAISAIVSTSAFASPGTVTSVLNGTIDVGTYVGAAPGQHETQTSIGSVNAFTTVQTTRDVENHNRHEQQIPSVTVTAYIKGYASSQAYGNGFVLPTWSINPYSASSIVHVDSHTTISNFTIPVTTINGGNGGQAHD